MTAVGLVFALVGTQLWAPMSLVDCIEQALQKNPSLEMSRAGLVEAQAEKLGARAHYLPSIWLQISDSYDFIGRREAVYVDGSEVPLARDAYSQDFHSLGISLRQNLFDGGVMWKRPQYASVKEERAQLDLVISQESVALNVIEAFFQLLGQQHALAVLNEALLLSQEQLKLAKERHRLGAASKVDVSLARLSVGEDKISLERQKLVLDQARIALNQAMGNPIEQPIKIREELTKPKREVLGQKVQSEHARLEKMLLESRLAQLQVEIAQAGWWPTLVGSVSYGRQDQDFYKVYSRFDELYQLRLSLSLSFPIFEGFAMQSRIESASAQRQRVDAQRKQIKQEIDASFQRHFPEDSHHCRECRNNPSQRQLCLFSALAYNHGFSNAEPIVFCCPQDKA